MTDGAGSIRDLQSATLLGTTRLAKLFGVSRYTIRMWAAGYEMNARSKERLRRVQEAVSALQLDSPEEVQRALLDGSAGKSLYRELLDELTGAPVHQSALTVLDLLGVGREGHDMSAPRERLATEIGKHFPITDRGASRSLMIKCMCGALAPTWHGHLADAIIAAGWTPPAQP